MSLGVCSLFPCTIKCNDDFSNPHGIGIIFAFSCSEIKVEGELIILKVRYLYIYSCIHVHNLLCEIEKDVCMCVTGGRDYIPRDIYTILHGWNSTKKYNAKFV